MTSQKRKLLETYRALAENYTTLANILEASPDLAITTTDIPATTSSSSVTVTPKKKKAKTKQQNSNKPKRPSSAYIFFTQSQAEAVKEELGESCSMRMVFTELAKRWKELTPKQKEPFNRMARESSQQYMRELDEYSQHIDDDEFDELYNDESSQQDTMATKTSIATRMKGKEKQADTTKKSMATTTKGRANIIEDSSDEETTDLSDLSD